MKSVASVFLLWIEKVSFTFLNVKSTRAIKDAKLAITKTDKMKDIFAHSDVLYQTKFKIKIR